MSASLSMYQASVPVFLRALRNLRHVLEKGEAHARERGEEPAILLQARLHEDMLPLVRQVQIATDMAKFGAARLAGVESPRFEDGDRRPFDMTMMRSESASISSRSSEISRIAAPRARASSSLRWT